MNIRSLVLIILGVATLIVCLSLFFRSGNISADMENQLDEIQQQ